MEFVLLVMNAHKDKGLTRVGFDWTDPRDTASIGVAAERIEEYRAGFKSLGLTGGLSSDGLGNKVELIVETTGLVMGGTTRSFVFSTEPAGPLVDDLSDFRESKLGGERYVSLGENWYLKFRRDL
jgi:hypothetical protein